MGACVGGKLKKGGGVDMQVRGGVLAVWCVEVGLCGWRWALGGARGQVGCLL